MVAHLTPERPVPIPWWAPHSGVAWRRESGQPLARACTHKGRGRGDLVSTPLRPQPTWVDAGNAPRCHGSSTASACGEGGPILTINRIKSHQFSSVQFSQSGSHQFSSVSSVQLVRVTSVQFSSVQLVRVTSVQCSSVQSVQFSQLGSHQFSSVQSVS